MAFWQNFRFAMDTGKSMLMLSTSKACQHKPTLCLKGALQLSLTVLTFGAIMPHISRASKQILKKSEGTPTWIEGAACNT